MDEKKPITHKDYMKSKHWVKLSKKLLSNPECKCAICGRERWGIWKNGSKKKKKKAGAPKLLLRFGCHHISYDNLGTNKEVDDILICCYSCHDAGHMLHKLSKWNNVLDSVYQFFKKVTAWEYEESDVYYVPIDFEV